jgi:hypothetical protein
MNLIVALNSLFVDNSKKNFNLIEIYYLESYVK